jgi:hypothetical protein
MFLAIIRCIPRLAPIEAAVWAGIRPMGQPDACFLVKIQCNTSRYVTRVMSNSVMYSWIFSGLYFFP